MWVGTLRLMDKMAQTLPFHFFSPSAGFSLYESEAAFKLWPHYHRSEKVFRPTLTPLNLSQRFDRFGTDNIPE